jgi:hypothetical protein
MLKCNASKSQVQMRIYIWAAIFFTNTAGTIIIDEVLTL